MKTLGFPRLKYESLFVPFRFSPFLLTSYPRENFHLYEYVESKQSLILSLDLELLDTFEKLLQHAIRYFNVYCGPDDLLLLAVGSLHEETQKSNSSKIQNNANNLQIFDDQQPVYDINLVRNMDASTAELRRFVERGCPFFVELVIQNDYYAGKEYLRENHWQECDFLFFPEGFTPHNYFTYLDFRDVQELSHQDKEQTFCECGARSSKRCEYSCCSKCCYDYGEFCSHHNSRLDYHKRKINPEPPKKRGRKPTELEKVIKKKDHPKKKKTPQKKKGQKRRAPKCLACGEGQAAPKCVTQYCRSCCNDEDCNFHRHKTLPKRKKQDEEQ